MLFCLCLQNVVSISALSVSRINYNILYDNVVSIVDLITFLGARLAFDIDNGYI
ncbi:hypothetical protein KP509_11G017800 [Ceratopteris richardii]|uniref:Uncharacterized protein n=1 Tax=Ceratopteris richardii TaxID=49495 RepID=A0A8T2TPH8_CERRI|nr:hypothetical protein KP509_11G017800 [Ceratopteris richardii]